MNVQEKIKGFWSKGKEKWAVFSKRVKILIACGLAAVVVLLVVLAVTMSHQSYVPLFSDLNGTDMSSVVNYLSENGVTDYKVEDNGTILVPEDQEVQLRASLLMADYPSSGFSYSTYLNNVGSLTTEAEREQLSLMEIQDRLAATIRCLDGVKDAVVNINLAEESPYVLDKEKAVPASASVVVTMRDGGSLPESMVKSIQTLLRTSIKNLDIENIGIVDSVGNTYSDGTDLAGIQNASQLKMKLEEQQNNLVRTDVIQLLAPLFGPENIRVSVRTTVDVDRSVTDATDYNMEDGADGNEGLIGKKIYDQQIIRDDGTAAGGTVGTDSNADLNTYVKQYRPDGNEQALINSGQNDYLYDQKNTQTEHLSGVVTDVMVSITINQDAARTVAINSLVPHVAKAAGINRDVQNEKISILSAPFYKEDAPPLVDVSKVPAWVLFAAAAGLGVFILLLVVILLLRRRRRKRLEEEDLAEMERAELYAERPIAAPPVEGADIMNVDTEKSIELRRKVRKFAEDSPEIAAQMVRNWLKEGDT